MPLWFLCTILAVLLVLALALICLLRTLRAGKKTTHWMRADTIATPEKLPAVDAGRAVESLQMAVRIPTVSHPDPTQVDWAAFEQYAAWLEERYPAFHAAAERAHIAEHALIYRWPGREKGCKPALWMAHQDVVPANNPDEWTHLPFAAELADGCLWGRGALDMKSQMVAMFECCEALIQTGYQPRRDLYFLLGCDEETGVNTSAIPMNQWFREKQIQPLYILDEGTNCFFDGELFDVDGTLACIHVAEKGFGNLTFQVNSAGGHASLPPRHTALGKVIRYASHVEGRPFRAQIAPPTSEMIARLLSDMRFFDRLIYANLWLLRPLAIWKLSKNRQTNAWIRSTAALTMAGAAPQPNVLPQEATAVFNVRTAPWDEAVAVRGEMLRRAGLLNQASEGDRVLIVDEVHDGSRVSSRSSAGARVVFDTVQEMFCDCHAVPSLMLGGTDSMHLQGLCDSVYRFSPFRSYQQYGHTIHSTDERIEVDDFVHGIDFFMMLCLRGDQIEE